MSLNQKHSIAVLGADSPIGLSVIRELGQHGVATLALGRSPSSLGGHSRYASEFATYHEPLAQWLPDFLREHDVDAIMAVSEGHLLQLAELKGRLGDVRVICPDADRLAIVLDKPSTLENAARIGIDVPASWLPQAGEDFSAKAASLTFPVIAKWPDPPAIWATLEQHGLPFEKIEYASNIAELLALLDRYSALKLWPLVQTWCPGYGLGQMLHMHRGKATLTFQHRRLREYPPSGGVSTFCEAVEPNAHAQQMLLSERLLAEIGWEGPAMVEYRHDPATGRYWLMEINGRFWGSIPLARHCGAHFAWEYYRTQMGIAAKEPTVTYRALKARYVIPDAKQLLITLRDPKRSPRQRLASVLRFLTDFLDPRVRYYVWSLRDPVPLLADAVGVVRKLLRRGS